MISHTLPPRFAVIFLSAVLTQNATVLADRVQYELTFESTWSEATHPIDYPTAAHFSGTVGATHNADLSIWKPGELATPGIKLLAERGIGGTLGDEIASAIEAGTAHAQIGLTGLGTTPLSRSSQFRVYSTHSLISFASMIAPSPDWIVGVHDLPLQKDGLWVPEITIDVIPYDAGTDSGLSFRSGDVVTDPPEPIQRITDGVFQDAPPMGTFTLRLLSTPGDLNGSGSVDAGDVEHLCFRLGTSDLLSELSGDDEITNADVTKLVEGILDTRAGDTNLDGDVDFADFLSLASSFGENGNWSNGDFDCNFNVDFNDFLGLAQNFGYSRTAIETAASVPEPSGFLLACSLLGLWWRNHRRS